MNNGVLDLHNKYLGTNFKGSFKLHTFPDIEGSLYQRWAFYFNYY